MTLEKPPYEHATTRPGAPFEMSISHMDDRTLVVLSGELDMATVPLFTEKMLDVVDVLQDDLVLDIGLLTFLDSSGLTEFVSLHTTLKERGSNLVIFSPTPRSRRVLELTGLSEVLTILPAHPSHERDGWSS